MPSTIGGIFLISIQQKEDVMGTGIPLHKTRGIDPHLFKCPKCGKHTNEIGIGATTVVHEIGDPSTVIGIYNTGERVSFLKHNPKAANYPTRDAYDGEVFTSNTLCDDCTAEYNSTVADVMKAGGIHWRCKECGRIGLILGDSPIAIETRLRHKVVPPKPIGIEFDRCDQH